MRLRVLIEAEGQAVLKYSTHTEIIDRLKPTGDWKIVVEGVSSGCRSQGLLRPRRCQRNLKSTVRKAFRSFDGEGATKGGGCPPYMLLPLS